jgi:hypothetical protein
VSDRQTTASRVENLTPRWLGYVRKPAVWREQGGFYDGASKRIGPMLIGRDISTPESNPMSSRPAYTEAERVAA